MILIPLEDLIGSELSLPRRKKKQHELAIDTEKKLSNNVYSSQQDVAFQTIPKKPILIPRPSTKQLFETPSTRPAWGKPLAILYQMMTLKPIDEPSEDPVRPIVRRPDISTSGTLRELSDDILQPTETDSGDVNINVTGTLEPISHDDGTKLPPLVEDILEQPFWPGRPGLDNGRPHSLKSSSAQTNHEESITSTTRPGKTWVKADILGILEVLWSQQRLVTFKDLCLPSVCSRMDVAQAFVLLVDLHKSKDVKLLQAKPYEPIYIQKYKDFF